MTDKLRFILNRFGERLWVKPMFICLLSVGVALLAKMADAWERPSIVPDVSTDSVEKLLTVISGSMLVMAVFAVGSMLAAYESASNSATPRSFAVVIADDRSQNALSTFVGAFIFSIVGLVAITNDYYDQSGRFALLVMTLVVFALVILNFLKWVDAIARLGRLGNTISKVETVAERALCKRGKYPTLGAAKASGSTDGLPVVVEKPGYIRHVDVEALQSLAEKAGVRIEVALLPGEFVMPGQPMAYVVADSGRIEDDSLVSEVADLFLVGDSRTFDEDPRFGLVVLSEIASRALSPAVNDPGTAIGIIGTQVRLFTSWSRQSPEDQASGVRFDRVAVPELSLDDMFDDAFNALARDGAGAIEVMICLQKALSGLAHLGHPGMTRAAESHAELAFSYAEKSLLLPSEIARLRQEKRVAPT